MDTATSLEAYASLCTALECEFAAIHGTKALPDGPITQAPTADDDDAPRPIALENRLALDRYEARIRRLSIALDALKDDETPTALCLSGGGIRSATFSLGVVESLARHGLLDKFHYLSTVSGGGYLGGWLSSWIARHPQGLPGVIEALSNVPAAKTARAGAGDASSAADAGPWPMERLRAYSNYLSPVWGASLDAFTLVATFVRNLWLHWSALIPLLLLVIVVARIPMVIGRNDVADGVVWLAGVTALALIVCAVAYIGADLPGRMLSGEAKRPRNRFGALCFAPLMASAVLLAWVGAWTAPSGDAPPADSDSVVAFALDASLLSATAFASLGAALYGCAACLGIVLRRRRGLEPRRYTYPWIAVGTAMATGACGGLGLYVFLHVVNHVGRGNTLNPWYATCSVPTLFFVFWLTLTFYAGLARRLTNEDDREWWSRAAAVALLASIGWAVLCTLTVVTPMEFQKIAVGGRRIGLYTALSGTLTSLWGFWSKRGESIKRNAETLITKLGIHVLDLAALAFTLMLAAGLGVLVEWSLTAFADRFAGPGVPRAQVDLCVHLIAALSLLALAVLANYLIGVNTFSLHGMYRNRIVRAYLGATNAHRSPHWFTGFDPHDNLPMAALLPQDPAVRPKLFHVVNVALNLARAAGDRLEWQQRKAASFTISPLHCGSALLGFVPTRKYARGPEAARRAVATSDDRREKPGITLGRAVAISGAAASPNMGYHTSTLVAFAMSFFNVRLGWWLPNPRRTFRAKWREEEPRLGLFKLLVSETLARTGDNQSFVYLSDGGHFENLGLYEMVRRRCRRIVLVDASEDPDFTYEDLEGAIRKIRTDLGVEIHFPNGLPTADSALALGRSDAIGTLTYPDSGAVGSIVYIKPALCGDEPLDVRRYAAASRGRLGGAFPHDPTWRQAFDEAQFESYRMLGQHCADKAFGVASLWSRPATAGPDHGGDSAPPKAPVEAPPPAEPARTPAPAGRVMLAILAGAGLVSAALALRPPGPTAPAPVADEVPQMEASPPR